MLDYIKELEDKIERLEQENALMKKALVIYGDLEVERESINTES